MLPQKLGLDVLVEKETGRLVTVEVNGENSGYEGLVAEGTDLAGKIADALGSHLKGKTVLVNPAFVDFKYDSGVLEGLLKRWNVRLVFSPFLRQRVAAAEFEDKTGYSLAAFDALLGFGGYLTGLNRGNDMVNTPAVQLVTTDKLLQYELLKYVPGLNMPETWLVDAFDTEGLTALQQRYGRLVLKPRDGSQGRGIRIVGERELLEVFARKVTQLAVSEFFLKVPESAKKGTAGEIGGSVGEQKTTTWTMSFMKRDGPEDPGTKEWLEYRGVLLQKFIETQPVVFKKTEQPHIACARLIWVDGYLGGYWKISDSPITDSDPNNAIVSYSITHNSQRFTPSEARMFRQYAKEVVPLVLERLASYVGRVQEYEQIEMRLVQEAMNQSQRQSSKV